MARIVPIVTELTYAELQALIAAEGLNEGLQYNVTDKDWLLVATGVDTLKAASGTLKISNEAFPTYIYADKLFLDTGYIHLTDGELYPILRPDGFILGSELFVDNSLTSYTDLKIAWGSDIEIDTQSNKFIQYINTAYSISEDPFGLYTDSERLDTKKVRVIFQFIKFDID